MVGVNTSAIDAQGVQNLNFAIAAHYVCRILDLLRAGRDPSPPDGALAFFADAEQTGALKIARNFMPPGYVALQPGDVISTGTPPGVGMGIKPEPVWLKPGQTMRLGIEGLGEQQQKTVAYGG